MQQQQQQQQKSFWRSSGSNLCAYGHCVAFTYFIMFSRNLKLDTSKQGTASNLLLALSLFWIPRLVNHLMGCPQVCCEKKTQQLD